MSDARGAAQRSGDFLAGKYLLEDRLGAGGMGEVYRAMNISLGRKVAIKILASELAKVEADVLRFLREARAAAAIRHANVVDVIDVARDDDGTPFIVQELLTGEDLEHHLRARGGLLSTNEALDIIVPVTEAVAAAHAQSVVHRDLKPANIFLSRDRDKTTPKVLDFGACLFPTLAERSAKEAKMLVGTPQYMAPEQIVSKDTVDARADIWALGIILYELVVGETPFDGASVKAVLENVKTREVPRLRERVPSTPVELDRIVARCTSRDRSARYPDAQALLSDLKGIPRRAALAPAKSAANPPRAADIGGAFRPGLLTLSSPGSDPPVADGLDDPGAGLDFPKTPPQPAMPFDAPKVRAAAKPAFDTPKAAPAAKPAFDTPKAAPAAKPAFDVSKELVTRPSLDLIKELAAKSALDGPKELATRPALELPKGFAAKPALDTPKAAPAAKPALDTPKAAPAAKPALDTPKAAPAAKPAFDTPKAAPAAKPVLDAPKAAPAAKPVLDAPKAKPAPQPPPTPKRAPPAFDLPKAAAAMDAPPALDFPKAPAAMQAPAAFDFPEVPPAFDFPKAPSGMDGLGGFDLPKSAAAMHSPALDFPTSAISFSSPPLPASSLPPANARESTPADDDDSLPPVLFGPRSGDAAKSEPPPPPAPLPPPPPPPSAPALAPRSPPTPTNLTRPGPPAPLAPPAAAAPAAPVAPPARAKEEWSLSDTLKFVGAVALPAVGGFLAVLAVPVLGGPLGRALRGDAVIASGALAVVALIAAAALCARAFFGESDRWQKIAAGGGVVFAIAMIIVTFSASEAAELGVPTGMGGLSSLLAPIAPLALGLRALARARAAWVDPYAQSEARRDAALAGFMLFLALALSPMGAVRTHFKAAPGVVAEGHHGEGPRPHPRLRLADDAAHRATRA